MNFLRQIVSGPKKRFVEDGYNLDLTYVCPRLIAMSFPASGLETLYRNNIDNVAKMIKNKHNGDYLIINLSGRKYDYSKFQDKVLDYEWEDHHSPPINTLFVICEKIHQFLKSKQYITKNIEKKENVAIIHCLAGKGRTGTIICCFMLYSGRFETPQEALLYYGKKRFLQEGLGVNQPCQIRYVYYFHQILTEKNVYPTLKYIKQVEFIGRPKFSDDGCRPFIDLINVHSKEKIFSTQKSYSEQQRFVENDQFSVRFEQTQPISGDILMRVKNNEFSLSDLSPSQILKDQRFPKTFIIKIIFGDFCLCNCNTPFDKKCQGCLIELDKEREQWSTIYRIIDNYKTPTPEEQTYLLFGQEPEDVDEILNKEKKEFIENKGVLQKGKISEESRERLSNFNEYMFQKMCNNQNEDKVEGGDMLNMIGSNTDSDDDDYLPDTNIVQDKVKENEKYSKSQVNSEQIPNDESQRKRSVMRPNIYDFDYPNADNINDSASHAKSQLSCSSNIDQISTVKMEDFNQFGPSLSKSVNLNSQNNTIKPYSHEKDKQNQYLIAQIQKQGQDIQMFDKEEERPSHIKNINNSNVLKY